MKACARHRWRRQPEGSVAKACARAPTRRSRIAWASASHGYIRDDSMRVNPASAVALYNNRACRSEIMHGSPATARSLVKCLNRGGPTHHDRGSLGGLLPVAGMDPGACRPCPRRSSKCGRLSGSHRLASWRWRAMRCYNRKGRARTCGPPGPARTLRPPRARAKIAPDPESPDPPRTLPYLPVPCRPLENNCIRVIFQ